VKEKLQPALNKDGAHHELHKSQSIWQDILIIVKNKQNWLLTGYGGLAFAPVIVFCGLWGNPFLQKAYQLDALTAPFLISLVFIGLAVGSPLFAFISKFIRNRLSYMFYSTVVSAAAILLVIYAHPMPIWLVGSLLFLFGFSLGAFPMVFVIGKEINPLYLAGTAISLINASDAFFDAITEPLIGKILDFFGHVAGTTDFSLTGYHVALAILPIYQIIGAFMLKFVKDEHYVANR
jgi:MFS family permease